MTTMREKLGILQAEFLRNILKIFLEGGIRFTNQVI